ncbi:MAG: hypothetical protein JXQ90_23150 [Cyclobacteriaceae bacterium]
MRKTVLTSLTTLLIVLLLDECQPATETQRPMISNVTIKKQNEQYNFYVNDQLFKIKGVGLSGRSDKFKALKDAGGNSFRTWSTRGGSQSLDSAAKYGFMVAMGLDIEKELHGFDYNDDTAVAKQLERLKGEVDEYKNHPNLLSWVAGNELNLLFDEDGAMKLVNPKTYIALKELVDYIHEVDPYHPVTTTFAGIHKDQIEHALSYCPNLDFISYQVYGSLNEISEKVAATDVTLPYVVTEFGPVGHWERPSTSWGREIEETSTEKAIGLKERLRNGLDGDASGLSMGGYAFLWGQKQERTPTWYGMFLKTGEAIGTVDVLTKYWSGKDPVNLAPEIKSLTLDGMIATDNITLSPKQEVVASLQASDANQDELTYQWFVLTEVKNRSQGGAFEKEPDEVKLDITSEQPGILQFAVPDTPSEYRLFCYAFDGKGKVATANIPFLITGD